MCWYLTCARKTCKSSEKQGLVGKMDVPVQETDAPVAACLHSTDVDTVARQQATFELKYITDFP